MQWVHNKCFPGLQSCRVAVLSRAAGLVRKHTKGLVWDCSLHQCSCCHREFSPPSFICPVFSLLACNLAELIVLGTAWRERPVAGSRAVPRGLAFLPPAALNLLTLTFSEFRWAASSLFSLTSVQLATSSSVSETSGDRRLEISMSQIPPRFPKQSLPWGPTRRSGITKRNTWLASAKAEVAKLQQQWGAQARSPESQSLQCGPSTYRRGNQPAPLRLLTCERG